jgi:hypothetical protein
VTVVAYQTPEAHLQEPQLHVFFGPAKALGAAAQFYVVTHDVRYDPASALLYAKVRGLPGGRLAKHWYLIRLSLRDRQSTNWVVDDEALLPQECAAAPGT